MFAMKFYFFSALKRTLKGINSYDVKYCEGKKHLGLEERVWKLKKNFVRVILLLLVVWAGVTAYFYSQHTVRVKQINLNEEIVFGDVRLNIKEITFENARERQIDFTELVNRQEFAMKLPRVLAYRFLTACYFYSRPYEFTPGEGTLKISGMAIIPENFGEDRSSVLMDIEFNINDRHYFRSMGTMYSSFGNVAYFNVRNDRYPLDYRNEPFVLTVSDKKTGESVDIKIDPQWERKSYSFFHRKKQNYSFAPLKTVQDFKTVLNNENKDALIFIAPGVQKDFPWTYLEHEFFSYPYQTGTTYIGDYLGFS
ncbi:MAG: hypothetical protein PHT78_06640, partial [Desulfitobacteriaceae bacterium]|nr:hypothetical protein [Desulfitobacteriaceae bacterium]